MSDAIPTDDRRPDPVNDLAAIGVTAADEAAYRLVLTRTEVTITELARLAGCSVDNLEPALGRLEELALITRIAGPTDRRRNDRLRAVRPDVAIDVLVSRQREQLARAQLAGRSLLALMPVEERHRPEDIVEVLVGRDAIAARFEQLLSSTREELLVLDRPPYVADTQSSDRLVRALFRAGVRVRGIYAPEALDLPGALEEIQDAVAAGEESRTHAGLPMKLAISDRRMAILPVGADEAGVAALCIRPSTLLDALLQLFELLWADAAPIVETTGDGPGDRELAALLASGAKDEVIARRLGTSNRTLSRRIAQLLDDLHVRTRFQAGVQAVRLGWIPSDQLTGDQRRSADGEGADDRLVEGAAGTVAGVQPE